eukprot:TRINITY_DN1914_c0_g1_i1.p1 TRINITY_DN1914_c0_g1~~TRINITY_DN1914_c0_g1_i1.p1  ORF type:complete len:138 (-),score=38.30 TRINITY_DN1914_c0_g1_i1:28-441(-)
MKIPGMTEGGLEFIVAIGWQKNVIDNRAFWTFDVQDPDRVDALKNARVQIDERKELLALKIEGAVKALEREKKEKEARERLVRERFVTDREAFDETQELRGGVKDSIAHVPVKGIAVLAPATTQEEAPMRLDDEEGA